MDNKFVKEKLGVKEKNFFSWDIISITPLIKQEYKNGNVELVFSYLNASKALLNCIREQNHLNGKVTLLRNGSIIIPFLFLCRHTLEITFKTVIERLGKTYGNTHNLNTLLSIINNLENFDEDYIDLINIFDMIDGNGMWLKYYKDLKNKKDYIDKVIHINSDEVFNTTEKMVNYLLNEIKC